jgi:hypothetical protein
MFLKMFLLKVRKREFVDLIDHVQNVIDVAAIVLTMPMQLLLLSFLQGLMCLMLLQMALTLSMHFFLTMLMFGCR